MLTHAGRGVLLGSVTVYALGWALGYPEMVVLAAAGFLALVMAMPWVLRKPRLVVLRRLEPARVQRGAPAHGVLEVHNARRFRSAAVTAIEPIGNRTVEIAVPRLRGRASQTIRYALPTDRRGIYALGPVRLVRADPLGLLQRSVVHGGPEPFYVHPRVHAIPPIPVGQTPHLDGPTRDTSPRGTATFHALREYARGDDLRHIHWRSSAHMGTLVVRQYVDTSEPSTTVLLNCAGSVYLQDGFEHAVEAAASITLGSLARKFPVRLYTTSGTALASRESHDAQEFLDHLASLEPSTGGGLVEVAALLRGARDGSSLVVITGRRTVDDMTTVTSLAPRFERTLVVSMHPDGGGEVPTPPLTVPLVAESGEDFARAWVTLVRR